MKYEQLMQANILRKVEGLILRGDLKRDGEKLIARSSNTLYNPYIHSNPEKDIMRKCGLWLDVYFKHFQIVPIGCRNCWKVVMTMDTLEQLMQVKELQEIHDQPSKCGIEVRAFTGELGKYKAYWYASLFDGLAGARRLFHKVVDNITPLMKPCEGNFTIILKRGCTEMERHFGDSSKWDEVAKHWDAMQELLDTTFEMDELPMRQPGLDKVEILTKWIEYAYEHGDSTYRKYAMKDFRIPVTQYQDEKPFKSDKFMSTMRGQNDRGSIEIP